MTRLLFLAIAFAAPAAAQWGRSSFDCDSTPYSLLEDALGDGHLSAREEWALESALEDGRLTAMEEWALESTLEDGHLTSKEGMLLEDMYAAHDPYFCP